MPSTKTRLLQNSSNTSLLRASLGKKYDPAHIYATSPPKTLKKREKNLYKISEVSNENKIAKKTFTRARKEIISQMVSESKKVSTHNFSVAKVAVGEG